MWFWFSLAALLCWSGSDLFSKLGCKGQDDKRSHLKMLTAVGFVMGLHCAYSLIWGGTVLTGRILLHYLPVSLLYISSMAIGYLGLRYIELSISSPICNSSGALVAILALITGGRGSVNTIQLIAVALVCVGVLMLGIVETTESEELRLARQQKGNQIYTKSTLALVIPLLYCLLDALGTFADALVLESLDESSANAAYELTFFVVGLVCFIYAVVIRKERLIFRQELPKYAGACFETAGQFAYIFALGDSDHVMLAAPIISAYCAVSVLWGRLFLKEQLSRKHYASIACILVGIILIGIYDI